MRVLIRIQELSSGGASGTGLHSLKGIFVVKSARCADEKLVSLVFIIAGTSIVLWCGRSLAFVRGCSVGSGRRAKRRSGLRLVLGVVRACAGPLASYFVLTESRYKRVLSTRPLLENRAFGQVNYGCGPFRSYSVIFEECERDEISEKS